MFSILLMQIMFLYNKDNDRVTILKQLNAQSGWDMDDWAKVNAPEMFELRGLTKSDYADLTSPWAITRQQEEFFDATMSCLAETIHQDKIVRRLFQLLILVSPSKDMLPGIAGHPLLIEIETELLIIMYRYLVSKAGGHKYLGDDGQNEY